MLGARSPAGTILHMSGSRIHIQRMVWLKGWLIDVEWRVYASLNKAIFGLDSSLPPVWHQAVVWTNAGLLLARPMERRFSEILIKEYIVHAREIDLEMLSEKGQSACPSLVV